MSLHDTLLQEEDSSVSSFTNGFSGKENDIISDLRIKSSVSIYEATLDIDDIVTSSFKKISRTNSLIGLTGLISEWGVVSAIHVLKLEDEDSYLLLDGLRRIFAAVRSGMNTITAKVWDFDDKEEGKTLANIISLAINRSERYTSKELWEQIKILEEVNNLEPNMIEFLLQLKSGDLMKIRDVMLSDIEYSEIRQNLMDGIFSIEQAYKKLTAERRKENRLLKEDAVSLDAGVDTGNDDREVEQRLSVDVVKDLLDLTNADLDGVSLEDMDRRGEIDGFNNVQDPHDRHPLDPKLKEAVLIRDNFTCKCCGLGGAQRLAVLVCHHVVEVAHGGPDSESNLVTLCVNCHLLLHSLAWGKVHVNLADLSESERKVFKNIFRYANIIIESYKRLKLSKEESTKEMRSAIRHPFPGEGLEDNKKAFAHAQSIKAQ